MDDCRAIFLRNSRSLPSDSVILDCGGGCNSLGLEGNVSSKLIVADIDYPALKNNRESYFKIQTDLNLSIPLKNNSVDLVIAHFLLEHLESPEILLEEIQRVLSPKGNCILLFPNSFALFAIIGRILPDKLKRMILKLSRNREGYPLFYHYPFKSKLFRLLKKQGYKIQESYFSYSQARYFDQFFPLYICVVIYECICSYMGWKNLSAFSLLVLEK